MKILVSTAVLREHLDDPQWVILDCRYTLSDPDQGQEEYLIAHIPGAVYLHLERDLCGSIIKGVTGRHPLPMVAQAEEVYSRCGISRGVQAVVYDAAGGALAAARAWWMLRWLGHKSVTVLDGGWQKWKLEDRPVQAGEEYRPTAHFTSDPHLGINLSTPEVEAGLSSGEFLLFDSRSAERYRGENETIDPVAGHIPGAISAPYLDNLNPDGTFLSKQDLRVRFEALLGNIPLEKAVFYCGSGVTAAHNLLAMEYAGLGQARLYAGSWSEWITDPRRPVAK